MIEMKLFNCNGAHYGDAHGTCKNLIFYPLLSWCKIGYSAYELETIAKEMRKIGGLK